MTDAFQKSRERLDEGFKAGRVSKRQHTRQMAMIDREEAKALTKAAREADERLRAFNDRIARRRTVEEMRRALHRSLSRYQEITNA
jgi:hypothetical protein